MSPSVLYKYRDDSERTEDIIRRKKVWLSLPDHLNDPLECKAGHIPSDWKAATIRELENGQIMGMIGLPELAGLPQTDTLFSLNKRQTRKWLARFRELSHAEKVKAMRKIYSDHGIELSRPGSIFDDMRQRLSKVGVFSLSESSDNELMWSHYAGSHNGLALGFKRIQGCKLGNSRHTIPVTYAAEKPEFLAGIKQEVNIYAATNVGMRSVSRVSFEDDVFRASLSTKTPSWSYEREWRYVEESHGLFDWPGPIESITFGLRMPAERRNAYRHLAHEYIGDEVQFFEVKQNESTNGFIVEKE